MQDHHENQAATGAKYAFIAVGGGLHALPAMPECDHVSIGGIPHAARFPETEEEIDAVWAFKRNRRKLVAQATGNLAEVSADHVGAMAGAIVEAARQRGCVTESDFLRAGVPARLISQSRDEALTVARQLEPRLDAMLSDSIGAAA